MPKNTHTYSCTHTLTNNESIIRSLFLLLLAYTYIHIYVYACHVCRAASICSNLSAWACKLWNLPLHINIWPSKSINCKTKHTKFHMLDIEEILHLFWFLFFFSYLFVGTAAAGCNLLRLVARRRWVWQGQAELLWLILQLLLCLWRQSVKVYAALHQHTHTNTHINTHARTRIEMLHSLETSARDCT